MIDKAVILTFIFHERLDWFYSYVNKKFNVKESEIKIYENDDKLIVIFKIDKQFKNKLNINKLLPYCIFLHKKNNTYYTINALNKLIIRDFNLFEKIGNINLKDYKIDWGKYDNKLILTSKNDLNIINLVKYNKR